MGKHVSEFKDVPTEDLVMIAERFFTEAEKRDSQVLTPTLLLLEIVRRYHRRIVNLEGNLSAIAHRADAANEELMLLEELGLTTAEDTATHKENVRNGAFRRLAQLRETRKAWYV